MNTHANTNSDLENLGLNDVPDEIKLRSDVECPGMADGHEDRADAPLDELGELLYAMFVAEERRAVVKEFREACAREFWVEDVLSLCTDDRGGPGWCSVGSDDRSDQVPESAPVENASQNEKGSPGRTVFDPSATQSGARQGVSQNEGHDSRWEILDLRNLPTGPMDRESQNEAANPPPI